MADEAPLVNSSHSGTYLTVKQMGVISTADICSSSLSIVGCVTILIFAVVKKKACHSSVQPLFHLALADFLASASLLTSCVLHKFYISDPAAIFMLCSYLGGCITGFFVITFLLTAAYAAEVYMRTTYQDVRPNRRGVDHSKRTRFECMYLMYTMSWILPLTIVISMVGYYSTVHQDTAQGTVHKYCNATCLPFFSLNNLRVCGPQSQPMFHWLRIYKVMFLVPLIFAFIFNLLMYIKTFTMLRRSFLRGGQLSTPENKKLRRMKSNAILFLSIFFICWLPTLVIGILSSIEGDMMDMSRYYPLYLLQAILSPLQGLLNTLGYGWQRPAFKQLMCPWLADGWQDRRRPSSID